MGRRKRIFTNILNVLDALVVDDLSNEKYQLYVIFPKNYFDITDYTDVLSDEVIIVHSDDIADLVCNKLNLDVLFPILNKAVRNICIPYIQYIADMQEEHLPKFFDRFEISERRKINKYIANHSKYIFVTSENVRKDIYKYFPYFRGKVFVQPFAPIADREIINSTDVDVGKYNLPERYFLVSNQFWQHKNHITVIRAINNLISKNILIHVVFTGECSDYRNPQYIKELFDEISKMKISDYTHFLGYIPKKEQIQILKNSVAMIQPSLFEGDPGGCACYEAVGLGKIVILSDTEVNKEIEEREDVYYFKQDDADELAKIMLEVYRKSEIAYSPTKANEIYKNNIAVQVDFFKKMFCEVIGNE
jgi:glycosyltransferase involved in cell wall biosynthesis